MPPQTLDQALARIEELEAEIAHLREELGLSAAHNAHHQLRKGFGLSPDEATAALALYRRKGAPVGHGQIEAALDPLQQKDLCYKTVAVLICKIRKKLGPAAVETAWGFGYAMTPAGAQLVAACIGDSPCALSVAA